LAQGEGLLIGYARVSTHEQKLDLQMDALIAAGCDPARIYSDKASGGPGAKRPGFAAAIKACRSGDTLVVWKLDRLGRSLMEVLAVFQRLNEKGAGIKVLTEQIDTSTAMGRFVMHILASLAEMERGLIVERTKAGLDAGRRRGRVGGRKPKLTPEQDAEGIRMHKAGMSPAKIAKALGVARSTIYGRISGAWAPEIVRGGGK
jgi:DNA invertase Pin-like site-specific DNA recombinase